MNLIQRARPSQWEPIDNQLRAIFKAIIFQRIADILNNTSAQFKNTEVFNASENVVRSALRSGRIQYRGGVFSGQFSAAIGKSLRDFGATWEGRAGVYKISPDLIPPSILAEAANYQARARAAHDLIEKTLNEIESDLDHLTDIYEVKPFKLVDSIDSGFKDIAERLEIRPELSADSRSRMAGLYRDNMKIWIKKFSKESIKSLRTGVEENALQGYRFDNLVDTIKARWNVSENRANLIARTETSIFMSKYRESRFKEAGVQEYVWMTSHDARVRPDHKKLDGKTFSYDSPPIADQRTGARANPGGIYNCRCVDRPILRKFSLVGA